MGVAYWRRTTVPIWKEGSDYWDYHGQEFPFIGFNELTKAAELRVLRNDVLLPAFIVQA
jgi:hypothetical protein